MHSWKGRHGATRDVVAGFVCASFTMVYTLSRRRLSDIGSRYIRSLYWVVCTVNGNGLGDIVPLGTSVLETAFAIAFLVTGSVRAQCHSVNVTRRVWLPSSPCIDVPLYRQPPIRPRCSSRHL